MIATSYMVGYAGYARCADASAGGESFGCVGAVVGLTPVFTVNAVWPDGDAGGWPPLCGNCAARAVRMLSTPELAEFLRAPAGAFE